MAKRKKNKGIEFVMETDWLFEKPIDQEHKEYKLLSYFQKMGEKLDNMELYVISQQSPMAIKLLGLSVDNEIIMNSKKIVIQEIN